ncbi:restriction endonuclease [Cuspidothrix issatschenkoi LEGE 03284]|jgi:restriction system protein|uniref:restriction endonuclease n=1 Tax=Cuspidothrix issatschenkoi TaxID=230752 RepID=UPI001880EF46|nr:restriction endonuclease [Cuspidothrix issatschenkoi]MBE9233878.1 restriction endonuclease [Cuspidothrix issatschenkoi LEGE 03284]
MIPIILGAAALAGAVVYGISEAKKEEERILASGINDVDNMKGVEFEKFLELIFKKTGYEVTLTKSTQDYGVDLILNKGGVKTVVQAKRSKNPVSVKAVQEVTSAVRHYKANKAIVITNNRFTENARILANSNDVELWDRKKLIDLILSSK